MLGELYLYCIYIYYEKFLQGSKFSNLHFYLQLSTDAMADYSLHSLEELNYLLAWTILSLTDNEHSTLPVRKKKVAQRESERCLNPVLDLLLHWLYAVMISLAATVSGKVCICLRCSFEYS